MGRSEAEAEAGALLPLDDELIDFERDRESRALDKLIDINCSESTSASSSIAITFSVIGSSISVFAGFIIFILGYYEAARVAFFVTPFYFTEYVARVDLMVPLDLLSSAGSEVCLLFLCLCISDDTFPEPWRDTIPCDTLVPYD